MKKPTKTVVPGGPKVAAKQPGNRPGRGKSAHAKPAHVSPQQKAQRHAAAVRAAKTRAKNARQAKKHPKRQLALAGGVACCSAEALAASLRLAGRSVEPSDVLALYKHVARAADAGASILATLEAACEFGLAGIRPASFAPVDLDDPAAVILGLDLPGPHAVTAVPQGWWSWGELYDPACWPDAVTEEAWTIRWEVPE